MKVHILIAVIIPSIIIAWQGCAKKEIEIGRTRPELEIKKCIDLSNRKKYEDAVQCLEMFKARFPKSTYATEAELKIADNYYRKRDYLLAADAYQSFVQLHPYHPKADYAYYKLGMCYLKETPKAIDRDQGYINEAIRNFQHLTINFPNSPYQELGTRRLNEARLKVAHRHYYVGRYYKKTGEYKAAIPRFQEIINNYPDLGLTEKSMYNLVICYIKLNKLDKAKEVYSRMFAEFPNHKLTKKAYKRLISASKRKEK